MMLAGMGDGDVRREVLSTDDIFSKSSYEIFYLFENEEMGCHITENSRTVSAVSFFSTSEKRTLQRID